MSGGTRVLLTGGGTGGHLYPALHLADALRRRRPGVELMYVGARRGLEAEVLPGRELSHRLLPIHPIRRRRPWRNWRLALWAPAVAVGARRIGRSFDPDVVVGTGGYASGPMVLWARLSGRPLALQEQNAEPGLVTRWMARSARQIHLGFPEAAERLPVGPETEVHAWGNPVAPPGGPATFDWPGEGRVALVAGGSQGARSLNERLLADLREVRAWPTDLTLVWIAGREHADELRARVDRLPWGDRIRVTPWIEDLGRQLDRVDLAVGRAGAMFVSELAAAGVPAVLVPYPSASGGHQRANARALEEAGAALVRREEALGEGQLWAEASRVLADADRRQAMGAAARGRGDPEAADRIADAVLGLADRGGSAAVRTRDGAATGPAAVGEVSG